MPTGPLIAARIIVNTILASEPKSILDLGMGTGKYGFLLREQSDFANGRIQRQDWQLRIDGVEGYASYIGDHQRSVYDEIVIRDVIAFLREQPAQSYDLALALDIIEHFHTPQAIEFIDQALSVATSVFVSTPKGFSPQSHETNELEFHRSWWPRKGLKELARVCSARISLAQVRMTNLAVLSRTAPPVPIHTERLIEVGSVAKDVVLPEIAYYRAIRRTGPTILDWRAP